MPQEKIEIVKGSVEHIPVDIADRLGGLTDLAGTAPSYSIRKESDQGAALQTGSPTVVGMRVYCLIDSTTLPKDRYELLVSFNNPPETPVVGPIDFEVV